MNTLFLNRKAVPLTLNHQKKLSSLWKPLCLKYDLQFAEYSFANVFLFRSLHDYEILEGDIPLVLGKFSNGQPYIIPPVGPEELREHYFPLIRDTSVSFFPIPDAWTHYFQNSDLSLTWDRDDSDYVFKKEKLQTLRGRRLSSRRNLLHQLEGKHTLTSKQLGQQEIPQALELLECWQGQSEMPPEKTDYYPCREALEHLEQLELFGRICYADGNPIGFTIGELLTPKTAFMHLAKSCRNEKGATPFMYKDFAINLPDSVKCVDLEQDLGIPSLRQAKEAYEPDKLLTKWRLSLSHI